MEQCVQTVAEEIVEMAKSKRMMTDNITLILVSLNRGIPPTNSSQDQDQTDEWFHANNNKNKPQINKSNKT